MSSEEIIILVYWSRHRRCGHHPDWKAVREASSSQLFLTASHADIETDHAILIARAHNRDIAIDIVFALDDLLRALRHVGAVTERNIVGELLLDGDLRSPRGRVGFGRQALGIDLDSADSEQFLHAAADGRVDRLADDEIGGFVGEQPLSRLLLQLLRLFAGATQARRAMMRPTWAEAARSDS